jgi:hypothetical protein
MVVDPAMGIGHVVRVHANDSRFRKGNAKEPEVLVGYLLVASRLRRAKIAAVQFGNVDLQPHTGDLAEKIAQSPFAKVGTSNQMPLHSQSINRHASRPKSIKELENCRPTAFMPRIIVLEMMLGIYESSSSVHLARNLVEEVQMTLPEFAHIRVVSHAVPILIDRLEGHFP